MASKIKNFNDFLFESEDTDTRVVDFLSSVSRNYTNSRAFYTDQLQFVVEEERRDWRNTRKYAKLEETITHDASYKLKFVMDEQTYLMHIKFTFSFNGNKEKDEPEPTPESNNLNVVLEKIDISKIEIKSSILEYNSDKISEPIRKACEAFLVKVLESDYDSLSSEIYRIEQKQ
jgi:hypothetical protein